MIHGRKIALAAAIAALISAPAFAGDQDKSKLDTNKDGKIDIAEAQAHRPDWSKDQLSKADANGDGVISDAEWSALPGKGHHYGAMDSNQDGNYSLDEVRSGNPNVSEQDYASYDTNKDGKVSKDELKAVTDKPNQ